MSDYKPLYDNSYALVIGIDSYSDPRFPTLGNAASDARSIADLLAAPPFNFNVTTLFNEAATRQAILTALFGLRSTGSDDRILFYFAGHGYTLVDKFNNETGYLAASDTIPEQDFTALELNEVTDLRLHAGAKHIAFVFDACFSGQALGLTRSASTASDKFLIRRAYQVISAGAGDQTVSDVRSMTTRVVEGLKGVLLGVDGMVTFSELGAYVRDMIASDSGQTQLPQFGHMRGSQGGDFVLYMDTGTRLPDDLLEALYSKMENIRLAGVVDLIEIAHGSDDALAEIARQRLEAISKEDPSQDIRHAAASFFLRESRSGAKTGEQRKVELVMQRRKPQELVNAFDALVPETADRMPVPDEVKKVQADLAAAETAKAATQAEPNKSGASSVKAARSRTDTPASQPIPKAAVAPPKKAAAPAAVKADGSLSGSLKNVPVWAWGVGGLILIAAVIGLLSLGGDKGGQQVASIPTVTASATPPVEASASIPTVPASEPVATVAPATTEGTQAVTEVVAAGGAPTATQFGGGRGMILFSGQRSGNLDIYSMSGFGSGVLDLTNASALREESPSWAPDGTKFAYVSNRDGNKDIFSMNADGSELINLTNTRADDYTPVYSHDGSKIAFISDRTGNPDVFVMNTSDFDATNLTNSAFKDDHPTWSPDDSRIAFVSLRGGNRDIFIMNSNGRGLINLTNNSSDDVDPAWSPDGSFIAFSSFRNGNWEIYISDLKGNVIQLTHNPSDDISPTWSPDSTRLIFVSNREDDKQLWMMDLHGEHQMRLVSGFQTSQGASWLN